MLLYLHPLIKSNNGFVNQKMDDDNKLCIFQMIAGSTELAKEPVKRELLVFCYYQVDVKEIKCSFRRWDKHETMFPIVGFFAC
jgi:hypothetical protein